MASSPPRLRKDLKVSRQATAGGAFFVIKDPTSGSFFRLQEAELFIAEQLDGETPLDLVRRRTEEKFAASLSPVALEAFVERLERANLLDTGNGNGTGKRKGKTKGLRDRVKGSALYLRFALLDPDRILNRLVGRTEFFFTRRFLVFSGALIFLATCVAVANHREIAQDLPRLVRAGAIPLILLVFLVVVSAHEFAHGLTCKHYGGEVHEMGFLLMYFTPGFYCNVSDAWLFAEKSKRLWVSFAGAYFELFLWALATLAWRVTAVDTWINSVALAVMLISGVKSLFNFNPFIKLDGYYLLSDYLDIPNLRRKAFAYFGATLKSWAGFKSEAVPEVSRREHRIFLSYGSVATVFSFSLLLYVYYRAGGIFVEMGQPVPLALLTMLVGLRSRRRFRNLFGRSSGSEDSEEGDDVGALFYRSRADETAKQQAADARYSRTTSYDIKTPDATRTASPEVKPPDATRATSPDVKTEDTTRPARDEAKTSSSSRGSSSRSGRGGGSSTRSKDRRRREAWRPRIFWGALAAAVLALLFFGRMHLRVGGDFSVLPEENADVRAEVEGIIERIYVDEGDSVRAGDPIARLSGTSMRVELRKTEAEIDETRANLRRLVAGPTAAEIEVARAGVAKAEDRLTYAGTRVARMRELFEMSLASRQELETAQEQRATAENDLAEARARLDVLQRGSRPEEIDATRARVERLEAQRRYLVEQLAKLEIVSPVTGIVATPSRQLKAEEGQLVGKGDLIAKVYDVSAVTAQIHVSEKEIGEVRVGQPVVLRARAYPDTTFRGTVTAIATAAEGLTSESGATTSAGGNSAGSNSPGKTFLVTTRIDNRAHLLKPGMTGHAKALARERSILSLLTRKVMRLFKVEFWSWW